MSSERVKKILRELRETTGHTDSPEDQLSSAMRRVCRVDGDRYGISDKDLPEPKEKSREILTRFGFVEDRGALDIWWNVAKPSSGDSEEFDCARCPAAISGAVPKHDPCRFQSHHAVMMQDVDQS